MKTIKVAVCLTALFLIVFVLTFSALAQNDSCATGLHDDVVIERVEPTATADGYEVLRCQTCYREFKRVLFIFSCTCSWDLEEVVTHPTCTQTGLRRITCTHCGNSYTENIPALQHNYQLTTIEPTCEEAGAHVRTCSHCGDSYSEYISALDHNYQITTIEPTCEEAGTQIHTCSLCEYSHTEYIPAFGHDYQITTVEATCEEAGAHVHTCSHCGYSYEEPIPTLEHEFGEWTTKVTATQGVEGLDVKFCSLCNEQGEERIIPALPEIIEIIPLFNNVDIVAGSVSFAFLALSLVYLIPVFIIINKEKNHYRDYSAKIKSEELEAEKHEFINVG